jgi:hypothetical protein
LTSASSFLRAAGEQSFLGDGVGRGDVALVDQAKREVAVEAFAVGFAGRELRILLRLFSMARRRGERGGRG